MTLSAWMDWLDTGVEHGYIEPPLSGATSNERTVRLLGDMARMRAELGDHGAEVAGLMREASDLGEQLAPDAAWPTDEQSPDLRHLWATSDSCRTSPRPHVANPIGGYRAWAR